MSRPSGNTYPPGSGPQGSAGAPQPRPPARQQPTQDWRHPADVDPQADAGALAWPQAAAPGYPAPYPGQPGYAPQRAAAHYDQDGRGGQPGQLPDPYAQSAQQHGGQYQPSLSSYQSGQGQPAEPGYAQPAAGYAPNYAQQDPRTQDPRTHDPRPHDFRLQDSRLQDQRAPDPRGYDLADYATGMPQRNAAPFEPQFAADPYAQRQQPDAFHPASHQPAPGPRYQQPGYEPQFANQGYAEAPQGQPPSYLPAAAPYQTPAPAYRGPDRAAQDRAAQDRMAHHEPQPTAQDPLDDYPEDEYDDEPKRGGRKLLVVGALVGAICVGGGLAYAFKAFSVGGKTPMIAKADTSLNKPKAGTTALTPGGPKVAEKLPEIVPNQVATAQSNEVGGPRSVQTIPVGPPGSQPLPAAPQTATPMPGMVLQGFGGPQGGPLPVTPPAAITQNGPAPVRPGVQPAPPVALATPPPKAAPAARVAAAPPEEPKKPVPSAKPKTADAFSPAGPVGATGGVVAAPPGKAAGLGAGGVGNGYVAAILSTQKGRAEAMKSFADLQQKYSEVLGGKPAEVQEKDLGETKGIWYRAVVGPPGSREAASAICKQLAAAGHAGCFATAY